ncbi:MAG: transglutaminase domain-containing protein [Selenomonadaceae bacterium]
MKRLAFLFETKNKYSYPVTEHDFLLRCVPQERPHQHIVDMELDVNPLVTGGNFGIDSFGNRTYTGRLPRAHTFFSYCVRGTAVRDESMRKVCNDPLPIYSYASNLTRPSESLRRLFDSVPHTDNDLEQAQRFRVAVNQYMTYKAGVTNVRTTAAEAALRRMGVCQDFTHVFLALCRMRRIPARYVSGLPVGEGASHAWAEVWYQGRWYGIDATRNCPAGETYLVFCVGRDFSDCPIEQGVFWGYGMQSQEVYTKLEEISDAG